MIVWKNKELIKIGWIKAKENFWPLIGFMLIIYVAGALSQEIKLGFIVNVLTSFVLTSVFLRIAKGEKFDFKKIFDDFSGSKIFHFFVGNIVVLICIFVGLGLLVVPGIIVALMLSFVGYILVEENKNIDWKSWKFWEAIKKSYFMTKGYKWRIFLLLLVLSGINILGFLAFLVGLLFTLPLSGIVMATLYEKLKSGGHSIDTSNIPPALPSEQVS